ncbi:hypothetical protein ACFY40_26275 [Streptomyces sp. NPDC012950]|uniref:hypothetical protein n=1 Tax=Streptomyces sp. NPDC012950 TaxID=3364858 RepID=UPI0036ACBD08
MWWGVGAALVANLLYSVGFVLEKRALGGLPALSAGRPVRVVVTLVTSPLWLAGALALAAGFAAQLVVYRTLPIAAAQGIFVSGLVLLLLLSSAVLGERPTGRERHALGAVLVALLMVVASVREEDEVVGGEAPWGLVLAVSVPTLAVGVGLYAQVERRARRRHRVPTNGIGYGVSVGLLYGVSSLAVKGAAGRLTVGGAGEVARALLGSPYPYVLLFTAGAGLVMSQTALQRCRASLIVPVCTTVTALFTAVVGTPVFGERLPDDPLPLFLRVAGTALALSVLLAMPRHDPPSPAGDGDVPARAARRRDQTCPPPNSEDPHGHRRDPAAHPGLPPRQGAAHPARGPGRAL